MINLHKVSALTSQKNNDKETYMPFPRIHPTVTRLSETVTGYIATKTPSVEARQEKLEAATRQFLTRVAEANTKASTLTQATHNEALGDSKWLSVLLEAKNQSNGATGEHLSQDDKARLKAITHIDTKKRSKAAGAIFSLNSLTATLLEEDFLFENHEDAGLVEYVVLLGVITFMDAAMKVCNLSIDKATRKLECEQAVRNTPAKVL